MYKAALRCAPWLAAATSALAVFVTAPACHAYTPVYGGPSYTPGVGGFNSSFAVAVNNAGTGVGSGGVVDGSDNFVRRNAFRFRADGFSELGSLSTSGLNEDVRAINELGVAVGRSDKGNPSGQSGGQRAVRWDAVTTEPVELDHLGVDIFGRAYAFAFDVNYFGQAVGSSISSFSPVVFRAVRWDIAGDATVLPLLSGATRGQASAINNAGTIVGNSNVFEQATLKGQRPMRWDASDAPTELDHLGTDSSGFTDATATAINQAGVAIGRAQKFDQFGTFAGNRGVRWNAGSTTAFELEPAAGFADSLALKLNQSGGIAGNSQTLDAGFNPLALRATRWAPGVGTPTLLGALNGTTHSGASAISAAGLIVGGAFNHDENFAQVDARAVCWLTNNVAIDLNTLIDPTSGWVLQDATDISDTGWVVGRAMFDPDGVGGQEPYRRAFLMQLPGLAADFNENAQTTGDDLAAWRAGFGISNDATHSQGDANGDLRVDGADFLIWQRELGATLTAGPIQPVPEPQSLVVAALAGAGAALQRRSTMRSLSWF